MRIVGGELRGRALSGPKSAVIRPTSDRNRESLFNILSHNHSESLAGTRMLDLFAGTGAVGLEALSRGVASVLFVDNAVQARGLLRKNIEALSLQGRARVFRRDATALGPAGTIAPFQLVFADPPYGRKLGERALEAAWRGGWLSDGALIILEERDDVVPDLDPCFRLLDRRGFGDTKMYFYRYMADRRETDRP